MRKYILRGCFSLPISSRLDAKADFPDKFAGARYSLPPNGQAGSIMKVTAQEEFGLRCLLQMARAWQKDQPVSAQEIGEAEGISVQIAGKILLVLKANGLASAVRGRKGGYQLSRDPRAITLDEVLTILGGRLFDSEYCSTHSGQGEGEDCVHAGSCTLRPIWGSIELMVSSVLRQVSLADLLDEEQRLRASLSRSAIEALAGRPGPIPARAGHLVKE